MVLFMSTEPQTLVEAIRHFADPDVTLNTMVELRWPTGVYCSTCRRVDVRFIATRRMWEWKETHEKRQLSKFYANESRCHQNERPKDGNAYSCGRIAIRKAFPNS
jgi:hypothetical protein